MRKLRIGIDLDGVVFKTLHTVLEKYNEKYSKNYSVEDIKTWDTHLWLEGDTSVYDIFNDPNIIGNLPTFEGAIEVIRELDKKHDVFLVSDTPFTVLEKRMHQLMELFPAEEFRFMKERQIFICKFKELLMLDLLLEDKPANIERFASAGYGKPIVFDWVLNRNIGEYERVYSWYEFLEKVRQEEEK